MRTTVCYDTTSRRDFQDLTDERRELFLSTKPYFIKRSREDGEKDLEGLVDSEENEGCWLFDARKSRWYNLIEEYYKTVTEDRILLPGCYTVNLRTTGDLKLELESCSHYHTHPRQIGEEVKRQKKLEKTSFDRSISEREKRFIDCSVAINSSLPSEVDIMTYKQILTEFPTLDIDFRIASPQGLIIVSFKKGAREANETYQAYHRMSESGIRIKHLEDKFYSPEYERQAISQGIKYIKNEMKKYLNIDFRFREE